MLTITVLLADDHQIIREGLRSCLEHDLTIKIIGEARNGREAVKLTKKLNPAVVVMDISMPVLNGLDATQEILSTHPQTKILLLSANSEDAYIDKAILIGAAGYLSKDSSAHNLARAIQEVHQGKMFFGFSSSERTLAPKSSRKAKQPKKPVGP